MRNDTKSNHVSLIYHNKLSFRYVTLQGNVMGMTLRLAQGADPEINRFCYLTNVLGLAVQSKNVNALLLILKLYSPTSVNEHIISSAMDVAASFNVKSAIIPLMQAGAKVKRYSVMLASTKDMQRILLTFSCHQVGVLPCAEHFVMRTDRFIGFSCQPT